MLEKQHLLVPPLLGGFMPTALVWGTAVSSSLTRLFPAQRLHQDWTDVESRPCVVGDDLEMFRKLSLVLAHIFLCPS